MGYAVSDSARYARILFDRDGALWGTTFSTGVFRVARPDAALTAGASRPHAETYEAKDGLSSNKAVPILEDREGNIWIGASAGLDRLRAANVVVEPGIARSSRFGYMPCPFSLSAGLWRQHLAEPLFPGSCVPHLKAY